MICKYTGTSVSVERHTALTATFLSPNADRCHPADGPSEWQHKHIYAVDAKVSVQMSSVTHPHLEMPGM